MPKICQGIQTLLRTEEIFGFRFDGFHCFLGLYTGGRGFGIFRQGATKGGVLLSRKWGEGERCKGRRGRETKTIQMNQTGGGRAQCGQFIAPPGAGRIQMDTS